MFDRKIVVVVATALGALLAVPALAAETPPPGAPFLTAPQLRLLYSGKTWTWQNGGGGYTAPDRTFVGAVVGGAQPSYAEGKWLVAGTGEVCWRAVWHDGASAMPAQNCFQHVQSHGVIYQRRMPDGDWYVFAHNPRQADDEINKLKPGNQITAALAEAKAFPHRQAAAGTPARYAVAKGGQ